MIDEIINCYDLNLTFVGHLVADLDDFKLVQQPFGRDRLPTIGHAVLHILASHNAMHIGQ